MPSTDRHRVAILGLMLESNRFAPVITEEDYLKRVYLAGDEILADLYSSDPKLPTEIRGFASAMDANGPWEAVPILVGLVEAGGPLDHAFFLTTLEEMRHAKAQDMFDLLLKEYPQSDYAQRARNR